MGRATLSLGTFAVVVVISLVSYGGCGGGGGGSGGGSTTDTGTAPTVSGVSPSSGYIDLDTTIQISGSNFASGATVKIGTTSAGGVTVASSTSISATVASGLTAGAYVVTVTNSDGRSATLANGFTATAPPSEWTRESLAWSGTTRALTSTCTVVVNNAYRTYFTGSGGIWTATSNDGLTWGGQTLTGVADLGATNPAVIQLANGTWLMIYGVQTAMPTTEILYRATSNDGVTFTKQGVALSASSGEDNFVSVPDLVYLTAARLRMYFVAGTAASRVHTAYSDDNGVTWTREGEIAISGGSYGGQVNDPDIFKKPDGTWWFFFTTPPAGQAIGDLRMRSAVSSDGRTFTLESGSRVTPSGSVSAVMDPDCVPVVGQSGRYRVYYGGNLTPSGPDDLRAIISP